jgi:antitoxin VapB
LRVVVDPGVLIPPFRYHSTMALNIKDAEAERLAGEVAALANETKTRAVKVALQERKERLALRAPSRRPGDGLRRLLSEEIWPQVPADVLGEPVSRAEREEILGYGPQGV